MDDEQTSDRGNDEPEDEDVEAHHRKGREAVQEQGDDTDTDGDDVELHMRKQGSG